MAVDRRVLRTRNALYDALVSLIRRKAYEQITVEDILREANVGRATFYAHFTSKDDLLERSLDRLRQQLAQAETSDSPARRARSPSRVFFEHVAEYRDIPRALASGRGGVIVSEAIDRILSERLKAAMPARLPGPLPRELVVLHIVAVLNTTLRWWLERGEDVSPAEAHALFARLVRKGLPKEACQSFL